MADRKIQHLVEIAVVESTFPPNGDRRAAHDAVSGSRIESIHELFHLFFVIFGAQQEFKKTADGHVGDSVERVEDHIVTTLQFAPKIHFDGMLLRRKISSNRVVHTRFSTRLGNACKFSENGTIGLARISHRLWQH